MLGYSRPWPKIIERLIGLKGKYGQGFLGHGQRLNGFWLVVELASTGG